jgi:murein hydrolase activator
MSRVLVLLFACAVFGTAALAQRGPVFEDAGETRAALQQALAEREAAEARSVRLEAEAAASQDAVDRTARQAAALAARVQQAEAGIAAADARLALIGEEQARLRTALGREQRPIVTLTAALQQFSRRPVALSLLRPGEVRDLVYLRAVMASTVPQVEARTVALRAAIDRQAELRQETTLATQVLRQEESALAERRIDLAALEARQRLAAREAGSLASREAERALALGEQARDLDALVGELDRAAVLRNRLAALPGPVLRPEGNAMPVAEEPAAITSASAPIGAPAPYILPVAGRTVTGFGAPVGGVLSQGLTLAPRSNAQVVAPAAGRVAFAGPYRGYGRIVIIEHAGGWTSLVTGLARSDVAVGNELVGGAPIGVTGPGRPTVTLELRRGGEPVNPLEFAR